MDRKDYIINYKETSFDEHGHIADVDSGSFDYGHKNEDAAKNALNDIAQKVVNDITNDGEDKDIVCDVKWDDAKDCVIISTKGYTAKYFVSLVIIPDYETRECPF